MFFKSRKNKKEAEQQAAAGVDVMERPEPLETPSMETAVERSPEREVTEIAEIQLKKAQRNAASKHLQASFGQVVSLLMQTDRFRGAFLSDLENNVLPAIVTGQFLIAEKQSEQNGFSSPVAAILWAHVSDEVDAKLSASPANLHQLAVTDWKSGTNTWIITSLGEQTILRGMLSKLRDSTLKGQAIKLYAVDGDRQEKLVRLDPV